MAARARFLYAVAVYAAPDILSRQLSAVSYQHECEGYDEEWGRCPDIGHCSGPCVPQDCVFGEWQDWYSSGGCTGLHHRERPVSVPNNECGHPCTGPTVESAKVLGASVKCEQDTMNCIFSDWSAWTPCRSRMDQATRKREIHQPAGIEGTPCAGPLNETKACDAGNAPLHCQWTTWNDWGPCSVTCGIGRQERMRRISQRADLGGHACFGSSLENNECNMGSCPRVDCKLGEWSPWSECDVSQPQRFRRRSVEVAPSNGGRACDSYLIETVACYAPASEMEDCEIGMWTQWSDCTKSCDGGEMHRQRKLLKPNTEGGFCHDAVLSEVRSCGLYPCRQPQTNDCVFSTWQQWSACDAPCGKGTKSRSRKISVQAINGGLGCEGPMQEIEPCQMQTCEVVDCKWSDWYDWSVCSATCNGGTKRRERNVAVAPQHGGSLCKPNDRSEIAPCNTESCDTACLNGEWASWSSWTQCSATCDVAYKSRRRDVAVQPSACGKPAVGLREEFQQCIELPACQLTQDCQMGEWGSWSQCSCHCFGIQERNRAIAQFASNGGRSCNGTVKEIIPCNPGLGEVASPECGQTKRRTDCVMEDWVEWSECTATCGGGQQTRKREIKIPSAHGGTPCEDILEEVLPCSEEACETSSCRDCLWEEWGQWGSCAKCGGQRFRYRGITQMPNHCGRPCQPNDAKQAGSCFSKCTEKLFCTWTYWSESEQCKSCGTATMTRNRALGLRSDTPGEYLFIASDEDACAGTQLNITECPPDDSCPKCFPQDCIFAEWSEWHDPTCLGLCERHRVMKDTNNECGMPCEGPTTETKQCPVVCQPEQDCALSPWSDWEGCDASLGETTGMQANRMREIEKMPMNGGRPCHGWTEQTKSCPKIPQDCELSAWDSWSECSTKCVDGWHTRQRRVVQAQKHGGQPCAGDLFEVDKCPGSDPSCRQTGKINCELGEWDEWTHCHTNGQMTRKREVKTLPSVFGDPCTGGLSETSACDNQRIDCVASQWSEWDECDRTCDGGQQHRHREIHRYPSGGGEACPYVLIETQGCNTGSCSQEDCSVSEWSEWGFCSTTCGVGQQARSRSITALRGEDGHGCYNLLGEVQACKAPTECETRDCAWGDWNSWSYCSRSCDGGVRSRKRHIRQAPSKNGRQCEPEQKEFVQACNTHKCTDHCIDGQWDEWSDWAECSVSCSRGTTFRTRHIAKSANECGNPPEGLASETRICIVDAPCVPERDCEFSQWGSWGSCSSSCDGMRERARTVLHYGLGHGRWCQGSMKELQPCNPRMGQQQPLGCRKDYPVDCRMGEWADWSRCTADCDGGVQRRMRVVEQRAFHGGRGCLAALSEVKECNRQLCNGGTFPVDCLLADWSDWGICDKCDGEKTRFRNIQRYAANGGRPCAQSDVRQVGQCDRKCSRNLWCTWTDWQDWDACSKTCGRGAKRRRRRYLHLSHSQGGELEPLDMPPGPEGKNGGYPTLQEQPTSTKRPEFVFRGPHTTKSPGGYWQGMQPQPPTTPAAPWARGTTAAPWAQPAPATWAQPAPPPAVGTAWTVQRNEVGEYETLYKRAQDFESNQTQELLLAFVAGVGSLALLLLVGRAWSSGSFSLVAMEADRDGSDDPLVAA